MAPVTPLSSSTLGLPPNSYIYKIIPTGPRQDPFTHGPADQLAVISSDDSLRFLDPASLSLLPDGIIKNVNRSVTCLERAEDAASNVVATAGRDGLVQYWDKRSRKNVLTVQSSNKLISSIVCNSEKNFLAAGHENPNDGPSESPVFVWDQRNPSTPLLSLLESHTDTVTSLQLHPSFPTLLLSSSTDGLINIFDISQPDEDEALYQVINHRSAVAHAGFMFPTTDIYALGTDETMRFYALQSQKEDEVEPAPKGFGDVREKFRCEYLAKMAWVGGEAFVAAGKHSSSSMDLIPIRKTASGLPLDYDYDLSRSIHIPGAHGEEIVRDIYTDVHTRTTYTCGEDSHIRAWKMSEDSLSKDESMDIDSGDAEAAEKQAKKERKERKAKKQEKKDKKAEKEKKRFKPY